MRELATKKQASRSAPVSGIVDFGKVGFSDEGANQYASDYKARSRETSGSRTMSDAYSQEFSALIRRPSFWIFRSPAILRNASILSGSHSLRLTKRARIQAA